MKHLCLMFLADNWLWLVLPIAICGILAVFIDVRFVIVALMVLFVVLPMILALIFFYYGLSPEARWSIMEKNVAIGQKDISLAFTDERMKTHVISRDNVRYIIKKDDVVMLMLQGKSYTCLMLPSSAIDPDVTQALRQFTAQAH